MNDLPTVSFVSLPWEILETIFEYLTKQEVVTMASISRKFRERILPFAMKEIKASWDQIIEVHKPSANEFSLANAVKQLRITDSNSYNEYQMSTFSSLLSPATFPSLKRVLINSYNSSYWLKYNESDRITHLTLYSDEALKNVKTFNLSHVNNFQSLRSLSLQNYHFNWTDEDELKVPYAPLSELFLHDCTWEYPFNLTSFNRLNLLENLTIDYSHNNPFTLSERFENFLKDPLPLHSHSLKTLSVNYLHYTQNVRFLSPRILAQFMSRFPNIEHLRLEGWVANLSSLKSVLHSAARKTPLTLHLRLHAVDECARDVLRQLEGPKVRIEWNQ